MGFHPCFGGSLQTGTKIVAMIQIIYSVFLVIISLFLLVGGVIFVSVANASVNGTSIFNTNATEDPFHIHTSGNSTDPLIPSKDFVTAFSVFLGILVFVSFVTSVCSLLLGIILYQGANQRNLRKCRIWLIIRSILMVISFISFLGDFAHPHGVGSGSLTASAIGLILNFYCIWVVWAFLDELREEQDASLKRSMYTIKP